MARTSLIRSMTRDVLEMVSPEEAFLVEAYDDKQDAAGSTAGGPQGFGAGEVIVLMLPYVYKFFESFLEGLGQQAGKRVAELLMRPDAGSDTLKTAIAEKLRAAGVPETQLGGLADAITEVINKRKGSLLV